MLKETLTWLRIKTSGIVTMPRMIQQHNVDEMDNPQPSS
jgi:hypothetical protein